METKLKQRILGGIVIVAIVVIVVPFFFGHEDKAATQQVTLNAQIPPAPTPPTLSSSDPQVPTLIQSQESQQLKPQSTTQPTQAIPPNEATVEEANDQNARTSTTPSTTPSTNNNSGNTMPAFNPQASPAPVTSPPPAVVTPTPTSPAQKVAVKKAAVVSQNSPTAAVKEASVLMGAKHSSSVGQAWAVQVGSFSKVQHAQALVTKLKNSGLPAYTETSRTSHGTVTRVLVGPEAKKQTAEVIVTVLQQKYQINALVIPYEKAKV